ncbi:MAG: hypothetical protein SEPTF4163_001013 [Sporothrix epigloea]
MSSANSPDTKKTKAEITNDDRSGECLTAFTASVQNDHNYTDDALFEYAKAVFEDWTLADLKSLGNGALTTFSLFLKQRGVYVGNYNVENGSRAQSILDTNQSEEPREWPQGTLERFARTREI